MQFIKISKRLGTGNGPALFLLQLRLLLHLLLLDHPHRQMVQQRRPLRRQLVRVQQCGPRCSGTCSSFAATAVETQVPGCLFSGVGDFTAAMSTLEIKLLQPSNCVKVLYISDRRPEASKNWPYKRSDHISDNFY